MKKIIFTFFTFVILAVNLVASEFQMRFLPAFDFSAKSHFSNFLSTSLSFDIIPFTIRERDDLYFSLQGNAYYLKDPSIDTIITLDGNLAVGYNYRINDRFSAGLEAFCGVYRVPDYSFFDSESEATVIEGLSGIDFGCRLYGNYYIFPSLIASVFAAYKQYSYSTGPYLNNFEIGVGITYNFSKGIFGVFNVESINYNTSPLFPVFFSRYDENSFGEFTFVNNEKNDITDVSVTVFIEQFMSNPKVIAQIPYVKRGEEFNVELTAFLNESILNQLQYQLADAKITVSYRSLGMVMIKEESVELQTLTRNSMSWEDDRRAAAFVSGHDGSAQFFAKQMEVVLRQQLSGSTNSLQYAAAVFGTLKAYGMNYVVDPASAFTDNTGTSQVDFLQFPYQTLIYHGGDCDDLAILNCSIIESLGINSAFITVPGHIFMAVDAGVPVSRASSVNGGRTIVAYDKVWIPIEITVTQDSFSLALSLGWKQWNKYKNEAVLIPLEEAWKEYKNVSIPESEQRIEMPSADSILREYNSAMRAVR